MPISRLIARRHPESGRGYLLLLVPVVLLLIMSGSGIARPAMPCGTVLHNDITINPMLVTLSDANGQLAIAPDGNVWRNGKAQSLNQQQRQQAKAYQQALRNTLPWMNKEARQQLAQGRTALDKIIVQHMGTDSLLRRRLTHLDGQLNALLDRIWQRRGNNWLFHHQAFMQAGEQSQQLLDQALMGFMQDSINEIGQRALQQRALQKQGNPLTSITSELDQLQSTIQKQWKQQQQSYQRFSDNVCQRMAKLQQQQKVLLDGLPKDEKG